MRSKRKREELEFHREFQRKIGAMEDLLEAQLEAGELSHLGLEPRPKDEEEVYPALYTTRQIVIAVVISFVLAPLLVIFLSTPLRTQLLKALGII